MKQSNWTTNSTQNNLRSGSIFVSLCIYKHYRLLGYTLGLIMLICNRFPDHVTKKRRALGTSMSAEEGEGWGRLEREWEGERGRLTAETMEKCCPDSMFDKQIQTRPQGAFPCFPKLGKSALETRLKQICFRWSVQVARQYNEGPLWVLQSRHLRNSQKF